MFRKERISACGNFVWTEEEMRVGICVYNFIVVCPKPECEIKRWSVFQMIAQERIEKMRVHMKELLKEPYANEGTIRK